MAVLPHEKPSSLSDSTHSAAVQRAAQAKGKKKRLRGINLAALSTAAVANECSSDMPIHAAAIIIIPCAAVKPKPSNGYSALNQ